MTQSPTLNENPSTSTLVQPTTTGITFIDEKHATNVSSRPVDGTCTHANNANSSAYPNLTHLLQTPTARTIIQSTITHLQRILDEDACTACAVESGVKSATEGVLEAKRAERENGKKSWGWWSAAPAEGQGEKSGKMAEWQAEGWDKARVKAAGKEMKGLVRGVREEMKREVQLKA
jgi:hypothetical protein